MILSIFMKEEGDKFQRKELDIIEFRDYHLLIRNRRGIKRIILDENSQHTLYDLKSGDLLHVYITPDSIEKFHVMPYVKGSFLSNLEIPIEMENQIGEIGKSFKIKQERISEFMNHMIENGSKKSSEKFKMLADAFMLIMEDPSYFQELKKLVNKNGDAS
ncbi:MAG: hypothetical protein ACTSXP_06075 [Promethearchaeota archaeon]